MLKKSLVSLLLIIVGIGALAWFKRIGLYGEVKHMPTGIFFWFGESMHS